MNNTVPSKSSVCICLECGGGFYSRTKFTTPGISGFFCSSICGGVYSVRVFTRATATRLAAYRKGAR